MKKSFLILICFTSLLVSCTKNVSNDALKSNVGIGGSMARYTIVSNYLYVVNNTSLKVFDISNPTVPQFKNTVNIGFGIETIYPFKDKLFIGSTSQVHIFSIANPEKPEPLGIAISPTILRRCDPVVAIDTIAYATLRVNDECGGSQSVLAVYNIADVTKPYEIFQRNLSEPYGLGYNNNALYVCDGSQGIKLFDISNRATPSLFKQIDSTSSYKYYDVIATNNELICWTSFGIAKYDITDEFNPIKIAEIK